MKVFINQKKGSLHQPKRLNCFPTSKPFHSSKLPSASKISDHRFSIHFQNHNNNNTLQVQKTPFNSHTRDFSKITPDLAVKKLIHGLDKGYLPKKVEAKVRLALQAEGWKSNPSLVSTETKEKVKSFHQRLKTIQASDKWINLIELEEIGKRRLRVNERQRIQLKKEREAKALSDPEQFFWMKKHLTFQISASNFDHIPPSKLPELIFVGRSNVGKGSLINALTSRNMALTSDRPGETQTMNWFQLSNRLCLIDMPGYGFAFAPEEQKKNWNVLMKQFISTPRSTLKKVLLLIDSRTGIKHSDHELMTFFKETINSKINLSKKEKKELSEKHGGISPPTIPWQVILTKTDRVLPKDLAKRATLVENILKEEYQNHEPILLTSSVGWQKGISSLRKHLYKYAKEESSTSVVPVKQRISYEERMKRKEALKEKAKLKKQLNKIKLQQTARRHRAIFKEQNLALLPRSK